MKEFWRYLGRAKEGPPKTPTKEASTPSPRKDTEFKELIGGWVYDNLSGIGVVITDREGIIRHLNAEAQALTSIPGNAANGIKWDQGSGLLILNFTTLRTCEF